MSAGDVIAAAKMQGRERRWAPPGQDVAPPPKLAVGWDVDPRGLWTQWGGGVWHHWGKTCISPVIVATRWEPSCLVAPPPTVEEPLAPPSHVAPPLLLAPWICPLLRSSAPFPRGAAPWGGDCPWAGGCDTRGHTQGRGYTGRGTGVHAEECAHTSVSPCGLTDTGHMQGHRHTQPWTCVGKGHMHGHGHTHGHGPHAG